MSSGLSKGEARYEKLKSKLSAGTQQYLEGKPEGPKDPPQYAECLAKLPAAVREYFRQQSEEKPDEATQEWEAIPSGPKWCICETEDGQFTKMRLFTKLEDLVHYLSRRDGEMTLIWPFLGIPIPVTTPDAQGQRYLILPGQEEAVPLVAKGPLDRVRAPSQDELAYQLDGWMGPPELSELHSGEFLMGNRAITADTPSPDVAPEADLGDD